MTQLDEPTKAALKAVLESSRALCRGLILAEECIGQDKRSYDVGCSAYLAIEASRFSSGSRSKTLRAPPASWEIIGEPISSMHEHLESGAARMHEALVNALPESMRDLAPPLELVEEAVRCAKPHIRR